MNGQPMQPVMGGPPQPTPQPQQLQQQQQQQQQQHQQQQQQQQRMQHQQIMLQNLRNSQQQLPPGWYTSLGIEQRLHIVTQLYTALRLAKPDAPDSQVINSAHHIEATHLLKNSNKEDYLEAIRKILNEVKNARQRAAQGTQASMMQQGNAGANMQLGLGSQTPMQPSSSNQGQNPLQQPFAPQFQHQMQNSPVPMAQIPSSMGMENPGMQAQQNQPQQNMNQMPQRPQMPQLSPQEEAQINDLARKIRARISPTDEAKIRANFAQLPPEKRQMIEKPGFDVLMVHSRQRAMGMFVSAKKQQMQASQAGGAQSGPQQGQGPGPAARVNSSQGPGMMQRTPQMGPAQPQSGAMPGNDFDFTQLTNQQAAAMRSAQAGHDVVPASNNSAMNGLEFNPMNGGQPGPMGGQGMPGGPQGRPPSQQPSFSLQQAQQQAHRENAIRSLQAQQAAAQARNQGLSPAQMQMAMRNQQMAGGFNMGQGQGGGMPMLTRPMAPPGPQGRGTPQPGPQQMPPNVGQSMDAARALQMAQHRAAQAQAGMPGAPAPNRASRIPPEVPEPVRQTLMGLPEDKFQAIISRWAQTRQMQAGANNGQQPGQPFGLQGSRPGMPMMGGNMPPFMQQGQPQGMNPEIQHRLQQEMMLLRQQQLQHQHQQQAAQQQPQRIPPLTPQVLQMMDQTPFPPSIAGQIRTHVPVPDNLKLWGQLKEWVARNPALPPAFNVEKLNEIQRLHHAKITSGQMGMINLGAGVPNGPVGGFGPGNPNGQAPQAPMMPAGPNQNIQQQQLLRQRVAQLAQSVTPADIAKIRQMQGPKAATLTDDQLRNHIVSLKMAAQAQRASQQNPQNSMPQPPPAGMAMAMAQPPGMPQPQRPVQPGQPQQTPQMKPSQPSQGPPRSAQPPSQPPDATPKAQAQKGVKRPNEEGGDSQERERAQAQPAQSQQRSMGMTKEQFETLTPQQQAAYRTRLAQAQGNKNASLQANMRDTELKAKFVSMMQERRNEIKVGDVVQLSNEERNQMANDAGKLTPHLSKLDQCLFIDWIKHRDETRTKKMITLRTLFHHQIDTNTRGLKAEVTLDPGKMQQLLLQLTNFMKQVFSEQANDKAQQSSSAPEGAQAADRATGPPQGQQAELSSANLEKLRQAQQHRPRQPSGAGVKPPNAPIATQPPFQLGAQSPHGAPMYAPGAVNNLTPEKLKMPPKKKAKTSASSTPQATPMPAPSPHVGTKPSPDIKREAAAAAVPVKPRFPCSQLTCECSVKGFDSKEDLEAHVKEAHAKVEDPLQFTIDSVAEGLGLNLDGTSKETKNETDVNRSKPAPAAPKVQPPAKAGQTPIVKADSSTPAAGATPMNRVPTQQGAKGSPSANFKTPQANIKAQTPGSGGAPAMNRTPSKAPAAKTDGIAPANSEAAATKASLDNPWDDCPLSPSQMYGMFADEDVAKAVMEMPAEYFVDLNEKIATMNKDESGATPATTPSPASTKDSNQTTSTETSEGDSLVNVDWDKKKLQHDAEFGQMMSKLLVFDDSADMTLTLASDEQDGSGPFGFWRDKLPSTTQDIPGWEAHELSEPFDFFGAPPAPSDDDALMELFPGIGKSDMDIDMPDLAV